MKCGVCVHHTLEIVYCNSVIKICIFCNNYSVYIGWQPKIGYFMLKIENLKFDPPLPFQMVQNARLMPKGKTWLFQPRTPSNTINDANQTEVTFL